LLVGIAVPSRPVGIIADRKVPAKMVVVRCRVVLAPVKGSSGAGLGLTRTHPRVAAGDVKPRRIGLKTRCAVGFGLAPVAGALPGRAGRCRSAGVPQAANRCGAGVRCLRPRESGACLGAGRG